jgi:acyl-CoA dehydrogenase
MSSAAESTVAGAQSVPIVIDDSTRDALDYVRGIGRQYLRPLGLEADRLNRPIPADHRFYYDIARSGFMVGGLLGGGNLDGARTGGTGRAVRAVVVAEEGAYWDRGAAVSLPGPGLGGTALARMGTREQRDRFEVPFRQRERPAWASMSMSEPTAGSDVARIRTRAVRQSDGSWVLNGEKMFAANGGRSDWVIVWATVDPDLGRRGHRAFLIDQGTPGFEVLRLENKVGVRAYESASFRLTNCHLDADRLVGGEAYYGGSRGFGGAMSTFNATRPIVAVNAVGIARHAHDVAAQFIREDYPAYGSRRRRALEALVEIRRGIEIGREMCLTAAALLDAGIPNVREASMAKLYTPPVAQAAVQRAAEILGEAGVLRDQVLEKLARDCKMHDIGEGTQQIQRRIVARTLLGDVTRDG